MVNEYVQPWYAGFIDGLDREMLFEVILAANYMVSNTLPISIRHPFSYLVLTCQSSTAASVAQHCAPA
jgi:hypothetical protein